MTRIDNTGDAEELGREVYRRSLIYEVRCFEDCGCERCE